MVLCMKREPTPILNKWLPHTMRYLSHFQVSSIKKEGVVPHSCSLSLICWKKRKNKKYGEKNSASCWDVNFFSSWITHLLLFVFLDPLLVIHLLQKKNITSLPHFHISPLQTTLSNTTSIFQQKYLNNNLFTTNFTPSYFFISNSLFPSHPYTKKTNTFIFHISSSPTSHENLHTHHNSTVNSSYHLPPYK